MSPRKRTAVLLLLVAVAVDGCRKDATAPGVAASISTTQAASLAGTVGTALASPPLIIVRDGNGDAVGSVAITVTVSAGAGTLTGTPARTNAGATPLGTWTLGTVAGPNTLTVTVAGLAPLTITAIGAPDVPSQFVIVSGGGQSAPANGTLLLPIVVRVADRFGNGVPNITTTFSLAAGNGSLSGSVSKPSDASGNVTSPLWTLGKTAAPMRMTVSAGSLISALTATVATNYTVEVRFYGPPVDPTIQLAFTRAAQRLGGMITGDQPDVQLTNFDVANSCGTTGVAPMTEVVDDVVIFATVTPIDGVGKVLGSSGPCFIRGAAAGRLTVVGVMEFDVADLQGLANDGRLDDVILHEMMHVLGFGTLWLFKGLSINVGTAQTAFTGLQAIQGCIAGGGVNTCAVSVPVENTGGPGTAEGHWRETTFRTELMTGFVSGVGVPNPLSLMTIGSMADMGYIVNTNVNDPYTVPSGVAASLNTLRDAQGLGAGAFREELRRPRVEQGADGRVIPIPPLP